MRRTSGEPVGLAARQGQGGRLRCWRRCMSVRFWEGRAGGGWGARRGCAFRRCTKDNAALSPDGGSASVAQFVRRWRSEPSNTRGGRKPSCRFALGAKRCRKYLHLVVAGGFLHGDRQETREAGGRRSARGGVLGCASRIGRRLPSRARGRAQGQPPAALLRRHLRLRLWWLVWLFFGITGGERRYVVRADEFGNTRVERPNSRPNPAIVAAVIGGVVLLLILLLMAAPAILFNAIA